MRVADLGGAETDLPRFVKHGFDFFLECGILAHDFLRLRCGNCGHDKPVAFSGKRRVVHRVVTQSLLEQPGLKADDADSGAVALIHRFGSAPHG